MRMVYYFMHPLKSRGDLVDEPHNAEDDALVTLKGVIIIMIKIMHSF